MSACTFELPDWMTEQKRKEWEANQATYCKELDCGERESISLNPAGTFSLLTGHTTAVLWRPISASLPLAIFLPPCWSVLYEMFTATF